MSRAISWLKRVDASRWTAKALVALMASSCIASPVLAAEPERAAPTADTSRSTGTRYPIVLCHGLAGWKALFGVLDYFHGIESALRATGAEVFVTEVPQFDATEARGEALLAQVEDILARTGAERVNLVGHSHGGLDARYVAAVRPDLVASVTTIGSPHEGAELADYLRRNLRKGGFAEGVVSLFANSLGVLLSMLAGHTSAQDSVAALNSLSAEGMRAFNATYPAGLPTERCGEGAAEENGVRYYSWSGTGLLTSVLDPSDLSFKLSAGVYGESSDGLVGRCSAHLGQVIRDDYGMNHLDEVNQLFGLVALFGPSPKAVFRAHASRLKNAGL